MTDLRLAARSLRRDLKSGEITLLLIALFVAVASLMAVGFFTDRIGLAVEQQAGEVLAADLRLESAREISDDYEIEAQRRGLRTARIVTMPSVVFHEEASALVALRAAGRDYPLRGKLKVADVPFGPGRTVEELPEPGEAWADSRLLARLEATVGSWLRVGAHRVRISRVLDYRPDQGTGFADLSPTLLINIADLPALLVDARSKEKEVIVAYCPLQGHGQRRTRVGHVHLVPVHLVDARDSVDDRAPRSDQLGRVAGTVRGLVANPEL